MHNTNNFSENSKRIQEKLCKLKLVYLIIAATWVVPTLINIPKSLEKDVEFSPGDGKGFGYVCYSKYLVNNNGTNDTKIVVFTETQYYLNLINDIIILLIIVASIIVTMVRFRQQVDERRLSYQHNKIAQMQIAFIAKLEEKYITIAASAISSFYVIVRLPLYIFGHPSGETTYVAAGVATILFLLQFCAHWLIHMFINKPFKRAFTDILRMILPCCFNCQNPKRRNEHSDEQHEVTDQILHNVCNTQRSNQ